MSQLLNEVLTRRSGLEMGKQANDGQIITRDSGAEEHSPLSAGRRVICVVGANVYMIVTCE